MEGEEFKLISPKTNQKLFTLYVQRGEVSNKSRPQNSAVWELFEWVEDNVKMEYLPKKLLVYDSTKFLRHKTNLFTHTFH